MFQQIAHFLLLNTACSGINSIIIMDHSSTNDYIELKESVVLMDRLDDQSYC